MGYSFNLNFIWVSLDDLHLKFSSNIYTLVYFNFIQSI